MQKENSNLHAANPLNFLCIRWRYEEFLLLAVVDLNSLHLYSVSTIRMLRLPKNSGTVDCVRAKKMGVEKGKKRVKK